MLYSALRDHLDALVRRIVWIMTGCNSHKAKQLARNSCSSSSWWASLSYWHPQHDQAMFECNTRWLDEPSDKQRLWDLFKNAPEPYGYNPAAFWPNAQDASFGVLQLEPWRIEAWSIGAMAKGEARRVWRA